MAGAYEDVSQMFCMFIDQEDRAPSFQELAGLMQTQRGLGFCCSLESIIDCWENYGCRVLIDTT